MEEKGYIRKQGIRSRYLGLRDNLSAGERRQKSREIWEHVKGDPKYQAARAVLVYMDYRSEVMTTGLVEELLADPSKKVFAPKVEGMHIRFYEIKSLDELKKGYQGIREPEENPEKRFTPDMAVRLEAVVLVPGAVFDRQRGRMGYGKGFYDRFLSDYREVYGIALSFSCQIAKEIPMEPHDRRPDIIVTEKGIIR
ncbi:MAG: 5-formyltetrahydrofolate cyclo-ligase [Lachnospiraceae bacterium]|nr:5-formyltetrahydrofolate cyclo-ligase [Lachnospiraceae bacterium]